MRILIAEDDATSRLLLRKVLARWGYDVVATKDGVEAWEVLRGADAPRLVVLDWMMPRLDGLEVCRRVRALDAEQPPYVILLTARGGTADVVEGLDAGANDYLGKPYDPEELRARVEVGRRFVELNERLVEAQQALEVLARTDALTGILNRGAIVQRLEEEMARTVREGSALSIGMIDIDHFKRVNDTYGHVAGDVVLREVVERALATRRPYDILGRFGGEEFLVIVPETEGSQAKEVLERIRASVAGSPITVEGQRLSVTVSVGGASSRGEPVSQLIVRADDELYRAKEQGRNRVAMADTVSPGDLSAVLALSGSQRSEEALPGTVRGASERQGADS